MDLGPDGLLEVIPAEAASFLVVDVQKLRGGPIWDAAKGIPSLIGNWQAHLDSFVDETGFDPFTQLDRLVFVFPPNPDQNRQFAVFAFGDGLTPTRMVTTAKAAAKSRGTEIRARDRRGPVLFHQVDKPFGLTGMFFGSEGFVLAGGGWGAYIADLWVQADGRRAAKRRMSVTSRQEFVDMWSRAMATPSARDGVYWGALTDSKTSGAASKSPSIATVDAGAGNANASRKAVADPNDAEAEGAAPASFHRITGRAQVADVVTLDATFWPRSPETLPRLKADVDAWVRQTRAHPQTQILGLDPYLSDVKTSEVGGGLNVSMRLTANQVKGLAGRLGALVKLWGYAKKPRPTKGQG